jgi:hypothetical protein
VLQQVPPSIFRKIIIKKSGSEPHLDKKKEVINMQIKPKGNKEKHNAKYFDLVYFHIFKHEVKLLTLS